MSKDITVQVIVPAAISFTSTPSDTLETIRESVHIVMEDPHFRSYFVDLNYVLIMAHLTGAKFRKWHNSIVQPYAVDIDLSFENLESFKLFTDYISISPDIKFV